MSVKLNINPETATLDDIVPRISNYNPDSNEMHNNALIIGGDPDGMINFINPTLGWVGPLLERMENNTWFSSEPDLSKESSRYMRLAPAQQRMFNITLAGLSGNDSLQTSNLAKNIMPYISDPTVRALLARQDWEEALHSKSYGVVSTDVYKGENPNYVFYLHREDKVLAKRNIWIQSLYSDLDMVDGDPVTFRMFLKAVIANLMLEGIMFQGGFVSIWSLGATMPGSAKMLAFIARDENTHLALFIGIFNSILRQFKNLDRSEIKRMFIDIFTDAVNVEIEWMKYVTGEGVFVFTEETIRDFIQSKANDISKALGYGSMYEDKKPMLASIEEKYGKIDNQRTNFFEGTVGGYQKQAVSFDDI